jgi:small-conductance mechanosensitive channel
VVFGVKFIRSRQHFSDIHVFGVDLVHWVLFLDIAFVSFFVLFVVLRGILVLFEKLAGKANWLKKVYVMIYPYEKAFMLLVCAIILLFLEPVMLRVLVDSDQSESLMLDLCWAFLAVSIVNIFSVAIKQILEATVFEELLPEKSSSAQQERLLIKLEKAAFPGVHLDKNSLEFTSESLKLINRAAPRHSIEEPLKEAAQKIISAYSSVRHYIREDDLPLFQKEKRQIMNFFDIDKDGIISEEDLIKSMRSIFNSRRVALGRVKSRRLIVDVTNYVVNVLSFIVCVFTVLLIFDYDLASVMISIGTALVAVSFAYSRTLQELSDSIYTFYCVQPFHVGDHVRINDGPTLIVGRIGMLSTFFYHVDGYGVYIRNNQLFNSKLCNLSVGDQISMEFEFLLSQSTSAHQIGQINQRLAISLKESRLWSKKFTMYVSSVGYDLPEEYLKLVLRVFVKKGTTWQETVVWKAAKTELILRFQRITEELGITFEPSEQPSKIKLVDGDSAPPQFVIAHPEVPQQVQST